jgi:hypothetical protein
VYTNFPCIFGFSKTFYDKSYKISDYSFALSAGRNFEFIKSKIGYLSSGFVTSSIAKPAWSKLKSGYSFNYHTKSS